MQNTPLRAGPKPKNIVSVCIDEINEELVAGRMYPVSYTHLDVYKRQGSHGDTAFGSLRQAGGRAG